MPIINSAKQLLQIVWTHIDEKNVSDAISACRQLNQTLPNNAEGWYATSFLAFQLRDINQSLIAIDRALTLRPDSVPWIIHKAQLLLQLNKKQQSIDLIAPLINVKFSDARIYADLALLLNKHENYLAAEACYKQAIGLSANDSRLYFNLATIERYLGKIEAAELSLDKAISLNPLDSEAQLLRSSLRKQTVENNHLADMQALLARGVSNPIAKAQLCYAIAKELEDLQQYQRSFECLQQGAICRRQHMQYQPNNDLQIIKKITEVFDEKKLSSKTGDDTGYKNKEAIFILGLPRTGSTLVERIISSHDQVYSAGELNNFAIQMTEQCKALSVELPKSRTDFVELTAQLDFTELGKAYIKSTRPNTGQLRHFIDKLPLNSLYVGLIHLALPEAKIIHVERHPLDTCYSIFKQLFTNGYPFSYDLKELAHYYVAHHRMMQHWKKMLPNRMHSISYESLIENLVDEAKNLIDYCELDWQENCCQFHLNKTASITASATQVRQEIYKSSLHKWRHFEAQLAPVKSIIEEAGIPCD